MPKSRKRQPSPTNNTDDDVERIVLPSDQLRELVAPDTFRVWHDTPSSCEHIGEFVVTVSSEGVRIWPSHIWHPSKLDATDDRDPGDPDAHPGYLTEWWELELISGRATELVDDRRDEIKEITRELQSWASVRVKEAQRIARAREAQRFEKMRRLAHDAGAVLDAWMPPGRRRVTWRDMVRRRRDGVAVD